MDFDNSSSISTAIKKVTAATTNKILEFNIYPAYLTNGLIFSICGNNGGTKLFHLSSDEMGNISWYDGDSWIDLPGADLALNAWNFVRVEAESTTYANVYVNGLLAGQAGNWQTCAVMDSFKFGGYGTPEMNDDYYLDDISFR